MSNYGLTTEHGATCLILHHKGIHIVWVNFITFTTAINISKKLKKKI